jgi:hypothetical protein
MFSSFCSKVLETLMDHLPSCNEKGIPADQPWDFLQTHPDISYLTFQLVRIICKAFNETKDAILTVNPSWTGKIYEAYAEYQNPARSWLPRCYTDPWT